MQTRTRKPIDDAIIEAFAREWAEFRLGGCPSGFYEPFRVRIVKAGRRAGASFSEMWAMIHKSADEMMSVDPRARLLSDRD